MCKSFLEVLCLRIGLVLCSVVPGQTEESPWLLGDWQGQRAILSEKGVDFEFLLTLEGVQNLQGGIARSSRGLINLDWIMDIQSQTLGLPENGLLHTYLLGNAGGHPTEMVGDFQTSSNIEAPEAFRVYEFYWQQGHFGNRFMWLVGLHDYNRKFNALEMASLFTNSSFGISPDISQVGPSIFPMTSLSVVLSYLPTEWTYLEAGIYDGVPGHPHRTSGTHIIVGEEDGLFYGAEGGYHNSNTGTKLGLGGWYRTTDFASDFSGQSHSDNGGAYLIGETLFLEHWGSFFQLGYADPHRNIIGHYAGAGITRSAIFMEADTAGLGLACAFSSDDYRNFVPGSDRYELVVEATYEFHLLNWLSIQPDIQYIVNPGMDPTLKDAVVASLRANIEF